MGMYTRLLAQLLALTVSVSVLAGCDPGVAADVDAAADARLVDAPSVDARSDAGALDAGPRDASLPDANTTLTDARLADADSLDAGSLDAGFVDASMDAGSVVRDDTGTIAPIDTGVAPPIDTGIAPPIDSGVVAPIDAGIAPPIDSGVVAPIDAGIVIAMDAGVDAPTDAGVDTGVDAGSRDAGVDAPSDAGSDAGPSGPTLLGSVDSLPAIRSVSATADGSRIAIGMPDHTYRTHNYAGSARIYRRDVSGWVLEQELGLGFADFETFGSSVAISGDGMRLAVARAPTGTTRYVHVYQRSGTTWTETQLLTDGDAFDGYATAVAISFDGYTLAVPRRAVAPTGEVLVYRGDATHLMTLRATLVPANSVATSFYQFGGSVGMSGDASVIAVGAPMESSAATGVGGDWTSTTATSSGAAYVFHATGADVWTQAAYLKASNTGAYDQFGTAIAVSRDGNTVAVGAAAEDSAATGIDGDGSSNAADGAGAVYVFARSGGVWTHRAYVKASDTFLNGAFGRGMTLSGDGSSLGVVGRSPAGGGAAYVFSRSTVWSQRTLLSLPGATLAHIASDGALLVLGITVPPGVDSGGELRVYALP